MQALCDLPPRRPLLSEGGARCRVRTCITRPDYEALPGYDSQIDSQKLRSDADLIELMRLWPRLSVPMREALLASARAYAESLVGGRP